MMMMVVVEVLCCAAVLLLLLLLLMNEPYVCSWSRLSGRPSAPSLGREAVKAGEAWGA